jgi:predicted CopG family antitoxin
LITISITLEAYEAVSATLPDDADAFPPQLDERDGVRFVVDRKTLDRLTALRGPGESYSDVILRMAKAIRLTVVSMERIFEIAAVLFAVVAAVFWSLYAFEELPQMVAYWDMAHVDEAAIMTSWAAGLTGASALCAAARLLL